MNALFKNVTINQTEESNTGYNAIMLNHRLCDGNSCERFTNTEFDNLDLTTEGRETVGLHAYNNGDAKNSRNFFKIKDSKV